METLTIKAPKGHVIDKFDESTGVVTFKPVPLDVMERINSLDDVFRETGKDAKEYQYTGTDPDKIMLNATAIALLIARAYNEGKEADWSNSNKPKFFIWQQYTPSSGWSLDGVDDWYSHSSCGARLAFLNRNHALKAYELFGKEVYQKINYLIPQNNE
jgi:hypothetical protein